MVKIVTCNGFWIELIDLQHERMDPSHLRPNSYDVPDESGHRGVLHNRKAMADFFERYLGRLEKEGGIRCFVQMVSRPLRHGPSASQVERYTDRGKPTGGSRVPTGLQD